MGADRSRSWQRASNSASNFAEASMDRWRSQARGFKVEEAGAAPPCAAKCRLVPRNAALCRLMPLRVRIFFGEMRGNGTHRTDKRMSKLVRPLLSAFVRFSGEGLFGREGMENQKTKMMSIRRDAGHCPRSAYAKVTADRDAGAPPNRQGG